MSENLFGLTVAADKGLDNLQCQRLLSENRRYQEVMLQYRCALKALESRLEILNEEFSLCYSAFYLILNHPTFHQIKKRHGINYSDRFYIRLLYVVPFVLS